VTLIHSRGLFFLVLDALVLAVIFLRPFTRTYDDSDKGEGNLVVLRPPLKPSYARCGAFLGVTFIVSILLVRGPDLTGAYHNLVTQMLLSVVPDPAVVSQYTGALLPVFQVGILAFGVAMAVTFHASLGRRLLILANVAFFLIVSAVVDAFFGIFVIKTGLPLGPAPVVNLLLQYTVAGIVVCRVAFTSFQLPRKTQIPLRRPSDLRDDFVVIICTLAAIAITTAGAMFLYTKFGQHNDFVSSAIAFACPSYIFLLITVFLGLIRLAHRRKINPTAERPPVEIIIPAYNEELNIAQLLDSLDAAAHRYGGPVRVILCDDGSLDDTRPLATAAMDRFQYATGEIIDGIHTGKSGALNQALKRCVAEFVYRVDADCIVHPDCILYSMPHFLAQPRVGIVGAFTLPKAPYTTWIDRMRMFELIVGFGMVRPADDIVDGIVCIPGTFTAFRRQAALDIGGFVEGMYGEDLDFTCAIARLGYRAVIDTRVRTYEDVPNTQRQLRVQRTRWIRGGTMVYSRYVPIVTGLSGPRFWFFASRAAARRLLVPLHMAALVYLITLAIFDPSAHLNLAAVGFALFFKAVPGFVQLIGCTVYYGEGRRLGWIPLRYVFLTLKHYYGLEAFLSFNARPVITGRMSEALRSPTRSTEAVEMVDL
jgi:cellulose synthase/poly-beta-1,6-N-acetylglucosamine synthase-like glycosyltransferase